MLSLRLLKQQVLQNNIVFQTKRIGYRPILFLSHNDNLLIVITINVFSSYYCESKTKRKRTFRSFAYLAERYCRTCALSSPLRRLTSVFGMGTGVPAAPFPPDPPRVIPQSRTHYSLSSLLWPGPRPISAGPLSMSPCLHSRSINLVVFEGP